MPLDVKKAATARSEWIPQLSAASRSSAARTLQVDAYKYLLWTPGNCASLRLAAQLLSDAAVLKLDSPELEWYYPLLTPYSEYIPVRCKGPTMP